MLMFNYKAEGLELDLSIFCFCFRHTASLATYVRRVLLRMRHGNGMEVCVVYGRHTAEVGFLFGWDF